MTHSRSGGTTSSRRKPSLLSGSAHEMPRSRDEASKRLGRSGLRTRASASGARSSRLPEWELTAISPATGCDGGQMTAVTRSAPRMDGVGSVTSRRCSRSCEPGLRRGRRRRRRPSFRRADRSRDASRRRKAFSLRRENRRLSSESEVEDQRRAVLSRPDSGKRRLARSKAVGL
jgi:hypothetical protein